MKLRDILIDSDFAGLYWTIPRDTPIENREAVHILSVLAARRKRNRERHIINPFNLICINCNKTQIEIQARQLECPK